MSNPWVGQGLNPTLNKSLFPGREFIYKFKGEQKKKNKKKTVKLYDNLVYLSGEKERYLSPGCLKLFSFGMTHYDNDKVMI